MNKGKTIIGVIAAMVMVVGLFFANKLWIAPVLMRQAQAKGIAAAGNHPMAPEFSLTTINGEKISLDQYKGKVLLVDFWATWCGPCRIEIPGFVALENRYHDQGLEIIGISKDEGDGGNCDAARSRCGANSGPSVLRGHGDASLRAP